MTSSLDGGLHPSRYTDSPDGAAKDRSRAYEEIHERLGANGWIVGRVTMAEMAKGERHPPKDLGSVGGAAINGSFLAARLIDELSIVVAPALDGGDDA